MSNKQPVKLDKFDTFRKMYLSVAEAVDAFRLVPRLLTVGYGVGFGYVVYWYMTLKTYVKITCNEKVVELLMQRTPAVDVDKIAAIACSPDSVVGGPVDPLGFIIAMAGLAGIIFGFYVNSGRNWRATPFIKWNGGVDIKDLPEDNTQLAPMLPTNDGSMFRTPNYRYKDYDTSFIRPRMSNVQFDKGTFDPTASNPKIVPAVHISPDELDAALPTQG